MNTNAQFRWGIAGPGAIATKFASGMSQVSDGRMVAVGSRSIERGREFADAFGIATVYGSYNELADDDDVDIVYVATPHAFHEEQVAVFLEAGKHVLCEKPMALNAAQVTRMIDLARQKGLFLMEAMWSRFLPAYVRLRQLLADGALGELLLVEADFGFRAPLVPTHRLFDPTLGGGALLDLGVYPLQLAHLAFGPSGTVTASGHLGGTGVDETAVVTLGYGDGRMAVTKVSTRIPMACTARLTGTDAVVELPAMMHRAEGLSITDAGLRHDEDLPIVGEGLHYQVLEVHRCLNEGRLESTVMPLADTLAIVTWLDEARRQLGFTYPGE